MLIVQPIATYQGQQGYIVYGADGSPLCLIRRNPGDLADLSGPVGPHLELDLMLTVSANQWSSLCLHMPGVEALTRC